MSWVAYLDESMRQRRDGSGLYVLAAAILATEDTDGVREAVRKLANPRHRRVHWRDAEPDERRDLIAAVAELAALHVVVVGVRLDLRRQERGRRLCLHRMLWELENAGVGNVLLETRTPKLNATDSRAVAAWRAQKALSPQLRIDFVYPSAEPLVWLPDIVAGAVSVARGDGDDQYVGPLASLLTEYTIELD